jgi:flagellar protein FliS
VNSARGAEAYRQMNVQSRSPLELVVMLYDGALQSLAAAKAAAARHDVAARADGVTRALAILTELQGTLDMKEGGKIAEDLDRLYAFAIARLLDVTLKNDDAAIDDVVRTMTPLREGWAQIAQPAAGRS